MIWDDVERQPDTWTFERYDWVYDAAAENRIAILTTLCAEDPPGWMRMAPFYHAKLVIDTPWMKQRSAKYLEKVVTRYKDHPAQGPWLLANEPALPEKFDKPAMTAFGNWLKAKYGTIDELNRHWFRPQSSFDEIQIDANWNSFWVNYAPYVNYKQFCIQRTCDQLQWIRNEVRKHDARHPTHINPSGLLGNFPAAGQDLWQERRLVDFLGGSMHAAWQFGLYPRDQFGLANAHWADLLRVRRATICGG